jgi:hypothetical protein
MTRAKYPGRCSCKARFDAGDLVTFSQDEDGEWKVTSCPTCSVECRRVADTGEGMKQPGSNLAARLRRRREKEAKRRAKG